MLWFLNPAVGSINRDTPNVITKEIFRPHYLFFFQPAFFQNKTSTSRFPNPMIYVKDRQPLIQSGLDIASSCLTERSFGSTLAASTAVFCKPSHMVAQT
jgi:hypothetical protein